MYIYFRDSASRHADQVVVVVIIIIIIIIIIISFMQGIFTYIP